MVTGNSHSIFIIFDESLHSCSFMIIIYPAAAPRIDDKSGQIHFFAHNIYITFYNTLGRYRFLIRLFASD
mgnify:CR=1 FL=1